MFARMTETEMLGPALFALVLLLPACNTTKATVDTTVKFFSSTSPDSLFTADGLVKEEQKLNFFSGVAFENLRHDIASGSGQYVASLADLMHVPADRHAEFGAFLQERYDRLFASDLDADRTAHIRMLRILDRELQQNAGLVRMTGGSRGDSANGSGSLPQS
ncbi:MAG TPA: DUF3015 family protein [Nitrospira sp.]|nr:DUF3015 family protein [Nitrospira sp.]